MIISIQHKKYPTTTPCW